MAGSATFTLGAQGLRVVATMLLTLWVSRVLGAEALGLLTLGLTLATIATIVACLGVDQGLIYFVARTRPAPGPGAGAGGSGPRGATDSSAGRQPAGAEDRPAAASPRARKAGKERPAARETPPAAAIRTALAITASAGAVVGALAWLLAPVVAERVFDAPALEGVLSILVPSVPVAAVFAAALGGLQGSFRVVHRAVLEWIVFPFLTLVLAVALVLGGQGIRGVAAAYVIAWVVSAAVAVAIALRIPGETRPLHVRPMLAFSLPLMLSLLTGYLLFHVDVLMVGGLASVREAGLYSVATRLALPLFLVLDSVARAFAPMVASLYSLDAVRRLEEVYAAATEWVMAINVPAGVFIAVHAEAILGLFGAEFVAAAAPLRVLCLGIVAATVCGAAASILTMSRWQRLEMVDNLVLLGLNVVLNVLLVPRLGALGAAVATGSSATAVYALKVGQVRWLLSVQPFRLRQSASVFLALGCAALSWLSTRPFVIDPVLELAVSVVVFAVSYGALWWRWGCSDTSREVLQAVVRRARGDAATDADGIIGGGAAGAGGASRASRTAGPAGGPRSPLVGSALQIYRRTLKRSRVLHRIFYRLGGALLALVSRVVGFRTNPSDPLSWRLALVTGTHEPDTRELVARIVRPGMTVVDVGAHVGYYTTQFADLVGDSGRVVAFEPHPGNHELLRRNVAGRDNVTLLNEAVSDRAGEVVLFDDMPDSGGPSLRRDRSRAAQVEKLSSARELAPRAVRRPSGGRFEIAAVRIDDALASLGIERVDLVKMDIEGGEMGALRGLDGVLRASRRLDIVFELYPAALRPFEVEPLSLWRWLDERDFEVFRIVSGGGLEPLDDEAAARELVGRLERSGSEANLLARRRPGGGPA